jgi:hypothetical protein
MSYFYILFCITLLLLSKYTFKVRLLLLSIILYLCYITFSKIFNVEEYIFITTVFIISVSFTLFDVNKRFFSIIEIISITIFKITELLLLLYPSTYISFIGDYYFYLDDAFISTLLFVIFSKEVGYHPFKMDKINLRKYILTAVISYLTLIFII